MRIAIPLFSLTLVMLLPLSACAGDKPQTVITTTEIVECTEPESGEDSDAWEENCTEVRRETTVVTESEKGCHGAVRCSFGLVGSIVSLPFRIVGEVLDTVF